MRQSDLSEIVIHLYTIENPNWAQINENHKKTISDRITEGKWQIVAGLRRGFLNCVAIEDIVYGYFAQEGKLRIEQFDELQQPSIGEEPSFERVLFLLFLESGILALQSVRISRYMDLTGSAIRESFFTELERVFRQAGFAFKGKANFERYRRDLSKEELIQIFSESNVSRVIIKDLFNSSIPDDFRFFNPEFDKDAFLKAIIDDDLQLSEKVDWTGNDIQDAKIVKGLIHAGTPTFVQGIDEHGEIREWEQSTPETISLELNTEDVHFPDEDLEKLLTVLRRKYGVFSERLESLKKRGDSGDLPLFNR